MSVKLGYLAEQTARAYLLNQGLVFLTNNFRSRFGEIDLIMQDKETIVFVEVRARTSEAFGGALASVLASKQAKIIKTATVYLIKRRLVDKYPIRFDVIGFEGKDKRIVWIKGAFDANF